MQLGNWYGFLIRILSSCGRGGWCPQVTGYSQMVSVLKNAVGRDACECSSGCVLQRELTMVRPRAVSKRTGSSTSVASSKRSRLASDKPPSAVQNGHEEKDSATTGRPLLVSYSVAAPLYSTALTTL